MEAPNNHGGSDLTACSSSDRRLIEMMKQEVKLIMISTIGEVIEPILENMTRKIVQEEIEIALQKLRPDKDWNNELAITTSAEKRSLKLKFFGEVSSPVLTGEVLNGKDGAAIRLAIVDTMTDQLVASGPESSPMVEILILQANPNEDELNWSTEDFKNRVIRGRKKGKPCFSKDIYISLERGMGNLCNVKLGHGSTWVKDCLCRLGARVVDNVGGGMVKEAWTKSFMVRDRHLEYYKKKETPSLSDKICRLHNIGKGGTKRLQRAKVYTVQDLLTRLLKDPDGLKNIVNLRGKKWDNMVKHARSCPSGRRMYCYTNSQRNTSVVFNIHGEILRLYPKGQSATAQLSSQESKDIAGDLFSSAIGSWNAVLPFDDENLLQQHLSSLLMSVDQLDSMEPGYSVGPHNIVPSDTSLQDIISNKASTQEIDMECIDPPASTHDVPTMHCLDGEPFPIAMVSNATSENFTNVDAGTERTGLMSSTEPFRNQNQGEIHSFDDASTSTSAYLSVGKNTCSPDFMQPMYSNESFGFPSPATDICDVDSVPPPIWNDNIQFSEIVIFNIDTAKWGWSVLINILAWRFSLKRRVVARKTMLLST
ncbi:calmodulin-binding protein 60 A-like isoform X2 [Henckelia pumila]